MFSKTRKSTGAVVESNPVVKSSPPSIISADLKIVGDLNSNGEIQIDGAVNGDIRTKSLLVGETANIKGEIVADQYRSCGQRAHHELRHHDLVSNAAGVDYDGLGGPVEAMDFALDIANQISGPAMPTPGVDWTRMGGLFLVK